MPSLGPMEIVLIILVIAIVFGWSKLPDAARSLGRSARIFKSEIEEMKRDKPSETVPGTTVPPQPPAQPAPQPPYQASQYQPPQDTQPQQAPYVPPPSGQPQQQPYQPPQGQPQASPADPTAT